MLNQQTFIGFTIKEQLDVHKTNGAMEQWSCFSSPLKTLALF